MEKRILYQNDEGGISIIIPTAEWLESYTVEDLAQKDVPAGVNYWIVEVSEVPSDRTFRDAWELDTNIGTPDGQGIGADAWFAKQLQEEVTDENPS